MRCKTAVKFLTDFVDGTISRGRERRLGGHLAICEYCREEEAIHRFVADRLEEVADLPLPEDGLHRLETRLAFLPPRQAVRPAGRLRTFALPYAAGLATAAAVMLLVLPMFAGSGEPSGTPTLPAATEPGVTGTEVADGPGAAEPLEGERVLTDVTPDSRYLVNERGDLLRLPPDFERMLEEAMGRGSSLRPRRDGDAVPVDWRDH